MTQFYQIKVHNRQTGEQFSASVPDDQYILHNLEQQGKARLFPDQVKLSAVAVLCEEQLAVDKVHSDQGDKEAGITDHVVNHDIQHKDTSW